MIIYNAIQTPDGTIIRSISVHDYVSHTDANGYTYAVDGGMQYLRRACTPDAPPYKEISIYSEQAPHSVARDYAVWGTRGKDGNQPLMYIPIKDLETDHIKAILETQHHIHADLAYLFIIELEYRKND
jgi:hypothetical protein